MKPRSLAIALLFSSLSLSFAPTARAQDDAVTVQARERFYSDVLPRLKDAGRTVVAVVHEDVHPACVDQVLQLRNGVLVAVPAPVGR